MLIKRISLFLLLTLARLACADVFEVLDIRVEGLQRVSAGTVFSAVSLNVGDTADEISIRQVIRELFKTGFFLDQRANRLLLQAYARGKTVLDCFSYTGGVFRHALEAGASDIESGEAGHEIICAPDDLNAVRDALEAKFGAAAAAHLDWKPRDMVPVDEEMAGALFKFLNILDDNEDVQRVVANFDVSEDVMERLGG